MLISETAPPFAADAWRVWNADDGQVRDPEAGDDAAAALAAKGAVVAVGNFDGVHRGHQAVIGRAVSLARELDALATVLTFEPHPRSVFAPDTPPFRLSPPALKARRIASLGVDRLCVAPFEPSLFGLTAEAFAERILADGLKARAVVVGEDFHFGAKRGGDVAALKAFGARLGFEAVPVAPEGGGAGEIFSSTAARTALAEARPVEAARILGDWHRVEGVVEQGDQRGRDLGFPTANLSFGDALRPAFGIYAVRVEIRGGPRPGLYDGVASIGVRPTFGVKAENFEVYLFDFEGDIYGVEISAALIAHLRPELKFDGVEPLIAQMRQDCDDARAALAAARPPWAAA